MSQTLLLQNRELPWDLGTRVVYAWNLEEPEAFCTSEDDFTSSADRIIVAGTGRCALHALATHPCLLSYRVPAECRHERLDEQADPATPRCLTCGAVGRDESARFLRSTDRARGGADSYTEEYTTIGDAPEKS
jgi:hypothetical protein